MSFASIGTSEELYDHSECQGCASCDPPRPADERCGMFDGEENERHVRQSNGDRCIYCGERLES